MSSLTVYKASAGSGKTFTLALEYIRLLISNPVSYRNILAVTFTNKATEEMKNRIIGKLYGISNNLPDAKDYFEELRQTDNHSDDDAIRIIARKALSQLIHNYDYFHVETIDTFFQSVLRNLAKELDLSANLRIELNDRMVEEQAVDAMIDELNTRSPLFSWLLNFVMDNINDNKGWNVIRSVKDFGRMIFNDNYKIDSELITAQLQKKSFISDYKKELSSIKEGKRQELSEIKDAFFNTIQENGINPTDFKGGARSGIQRYFEKLTNEDLDDKNFMQSTVLKCINSEENWTTKTSPQRESIKELANSTLIPMLEKAEKTRKEAQYAIQSVDATLKNINSLRLLNDVERKVREMNAEANRFLLSDTQHLLQLMINDSDSPFIFEKIGTRLEHIMIDEFQDTSSVQWQNFLVLLNECISHYSQAGDNVNNLIVGDVKQSIYRWRSGDWQLLKNINKFFPGHNVDTRELKVNYRSKRNIVAFNNAFFKYGIKYEAIRERETDEEEAKLIEEAYSDVEQISLKEKAEGFVRIKLFAKDNYEEKMLKETEAVIDEILSKGTPQHKIAILLRSNKNIPLIANYFMENRPDINIVSDEAFRLDRSIAVKTVVAALKYVENQNNLINKAQLIKNFILCKTGKCLSDNALFDTNSASDILPKEFCENINTLKRMPLYELAERIFSLLQINNMQCESAYICAFFDSLANYIENTSSDLSGFIREWDENIHSNTIQTDGVDGIRLISIHKSKGLEYDNVIIPFCDWMLEMYSSNYIWCHPSRKPYSKLPLIPVNYSPKLANSVYSADYRHEHLQNTIDNLNLLYVAFTRAANNLYVFGKRDTKSTRSSLIQACICDEALLSLPDSTLTGETDKNDDICFEFGTFAQSDISEEAHDGKDDKEEENIFLRQSTPIDVDIYSHNIPLTFRQSNKSKDFTADIAGGDELQSRNYIKFGNILHLIFSRIHTVEDIPMILDEYESTGVLYEGNLNRKELDLKLRSYINSDKTATDWFSPHWKLYNECSVLKTVTENGKEKVVERRPDRVMRNRDKIVVVDFKFGKMHDEYHDQVREYMKIFHDMGFTDVKGYLWFVMKKQIVSVTL